MKFSRTRLLSWNASLSFLTALSFLLHPVVASAFSDLSGSDELTQAALDLQERAILSGFPDGSFRPNQKVTRAEAVKMIVLSIGLTETDLAKPPADGFDDVSADAWFAPYVTTAASVLHIVDGPGKAQYFRPGKAVSKAEFLKMMFLAHGYDLSMYGEIKLPLSSDVTNPDVWFFPFIRLAFATSATSIPKSGLISPGRDLTRGDTALLLDRFLQYKDGKRVQALLSFTEEDILRLTKALNANQLKEAEYASARSLLTARGAHDAAPKEPLVSGVVKIAEAYRALVRAYRAMLELRYSDAEKLSKDAWGIASTATGLSSSLQTLSKEVQENAQKLAADARSRK
jgi:hypothetical protein